MKSKHLLLMLLMAFFAPWAAQAQEELTVYDGEATNGNVPVYGYYADAFNKAEMIMSADDLSAMAGGSINGMTWYLSSPAADAWGGNFQVYLAEVIDATFTTFLGVDNATLVWEGPLDGTGSTIELEFTSGYTYSGGNLFIAVYQTAKGSYKTASFAGSAVTSASISNYSYSSLDAITTGTVRDFLPKTTFTYTPGSGSYCARPTNVEITRDGTTATVTWEGEAIDYNIDVNGTVTNNIISPYTFEVELSTTYSVLVQANCEDGLQSNWSNPVTLTTPDCWEGVVVEYTLNDSYGDGWNGNAIQVVEACGNIVATLTIENGSSNSGTLSLCGEYYEFVWVKGMYSNETSWTFTVNGTEAFSGTGNTNMATGDVLYTLGAESCARPDNLAASNVTNHSATLTWTGAEGQNNWEIKYNAGADFDPETEGTLVEEEFGITTPDYTFNKTLEANTHYYVYVRANCGDENYSCWVGADFTTGIANPSPTVTTVDEITPVSAVLRWTAPAGDFLESYDICYSMTQGQPTEESEIQYTGIDAGFTTKILENLTEGYWYVYMRAYHGEADGYSSWTPYYGYGFQVPEACPEPTGLAASDPTPNSITLTWTEGAEWQYAWKVAYSTDPEFNPEEMDPETFVDVFGQQGPTITCTVNGLESETTYYFKVLGNCNSPYGDSDWTDAVSETTLVACPVPTDLNVTVAQASATLSWTGYSDSYTVQYRTAGGYDSEIFQGFEDGMGEWTTNNCHSNTGVTTNYGDAMFRFYYTANYPQYLISPLLNGDNGGTMSFQYARYSNSYTEYFKVGYSTTTDDPEEFTWDEEVSVTNSYSTEFLEYTYTIPAGTKYVSIACTSDDAFYLFIDDITIQCGEYNEPGEWIAIENVEEETITIEGLEFGTKYDAQVKANCGDEYCDYVTFTTNALKTFTTEGDWSVASNWTPAGVPTIEDVVSIEAAATITDIAYASEININGGSITIADGGQLVHNNTGVAATVKKTINGVGEANWNADNNDGSYFIANPLTTSVYPEDAGLITDDNEDPTNYTYDLYDWAPSFSLEWRNYREGEFNSLSYYNTPAYLYANIDTVTLAFTGTVRGSQNRVSAPVYVSGARFGAWNLIGNPFVCNAYLVDNDGNALPYYKMNNAGNGYDAVTGEAIAPVTGIFYEAPANGSVYFTREAPAKSGSLNMVVSQGRGVVDNAIIRFGEGQQMSKFSFRENSSMIYMPVEGKDYAIANATEVGEMPVNFKAENNGNFTMNFTSENVSFNYLHLIDNMTGADVDLLATPSYSFSAQSTDYANRFKLVFATGNNSNEDNFAFFSNGSFVINNDGEATLQVVDVMGRIIKSETINGSASVNVNAAPGVYMLRLVNGDNMKVQKVVVK